MGRAAQGTPLNRSFMHLHIGFDGAGLEGLEMHHIIVNSWAGGVDAEQVWQRRCGSETHTSEPVGSVLLRCACTGGCALLWLQAVP